MGVAAHDDGEDGLVVHFAHTLMRKGVYNKLKELKNDSQLIEN